MILHTLGPNPKTPKLERCDRLNAGVLMGKHMDFKEQQEQYAPCLGAKISVDQRKLEFWLVLPRLIIKAFQDS